MHAAIKALCYEEQGYLIFTGDITEMEEEVRFSLSEEIYAAGLTIWDDMVRLAWKGDVLVASWVFGMSLQEALDWPGKYSTPAG
jgi:hypothetical protein